MLKHLFVVVIIASFGCFLYGIRNIFLEVEDNSCWMTYMFGQPQFLKIPTKTLEFNNYELYYYYEGRVQKDENFVKFTGAPVLFIPGNGGSYKQARSLASVALRKGMENEHNIHLDYFTIDFNEELSGLFGGYLEIQKRFVKLCIQRILQLYSKKHPQKIVLIGHSMGGKIAQAIMAEEEIANAITTIITISSPLDSPVLNIDIPMNNFYEKTFSILSKHRRIQKADNETNACSSSYQRIPDKLISSNSNSLTDILLISIGGGNRDLLVREGYTSSKFSDIHVMTSSIPKVWLSCDHLSSVWCLQLVLVINRFLFSITKLNEHKYVSFNGNRTFCIQLASQFFVKHRTRSKIFEIDLAKNSETGISWHSDSKRVFGKQFRRGLKQTYNQMIELKKYDNFKKLYVEVRNVDSYNWLYGCTAKSLPSGHFVCEKATSLTHHVRSIPSNGQERAIAVIDLHNIRRAYSSWSHIVISLPMKNKPMSFNVDIHEPLERNVQLIAPEWFAYQKKYIFNETLYGTTYYKLLISGINEQFKSVKVNIESINCGQTSYEVVSKVCIPWAPGFERYIIINENTTDAAAYINVPFSSPHNFNTSKNPVTMEIFLDPNCRFSISYQFSLASTMSRIVFNCYQWLPSHLTAVLLLVLKNQISNIDNPGPVRTLTPYTEYFQYSSLYIITGCRIFRKLFMSIKYLPIINIPNSSLAVSIIVHSAAIVSSIVLSIGIWIALVLHGNLLSRIASRLCNISLDASSFIVTSITAFPTTFGVVIVSLALGTYSGIALVLACVVYFIMLANAYKEHLENLLVEVAKDRLEKFRSKSNIQLHEEERANIDSVSPTTTNPTIDNTSSISFTDSNEDAHHSFPFHITMFILLVEMTALNAAGTMAWIRNYRNGLGETIDDGSLTLSIVVLLSLSFIWQLKIPNKWRGNQSLSILLYVCASICVLYCQYEVYRLNYVIVFVYIAILTQELIRRMSQILKF